AMTRTIPKAHTIKWLLSVDNSIKITKGGKKQLVAIVRRPSMFWSGIQKGDVVQFVPHPGLKGAKIKRVEFVSTNGSRTLPFKEDEIRDSNFYPVVSDTRSFRAEGYVQTSDGHIWGCKVDKNGNKGVPGCTKPKCG